MMTTLLTIVTILFYISLFVELFLYSIPSVVATKKILYSSPSNSEHFSEQTKKVMNWSMAKKIIVFVAPMIFIYILHGLPAFFLYSLNFSDTTLHNTYSIYYLGIVIVIVGRYISHYYLISIKKIKAKSFEGFVTNGLFKFSRNPGLLGLYISFFGFLIIMPTALFLVCFIIYIVHMHFKIKMEEDYLTNQHGEEYRAYIQKTKRYL